MKLRILSWNVNGANDNDKRKLIEVVIKSRKVDLACLQETKIQEMSNGIAQSLGVERCLEWGTMNLKGAGGRVVMFRDNRVLQLVELDEGNFSISYRFKNYEDGFCWSFTGVYGPTLEMESEGF